MGWEVGKRKLAFYADYGRIVGREPYWFQDALLIMVEMFCRVGLQTNLEKTNAMVCTPGFIWGYIGEEAYKGRETGEGVTFW